jgi:ABC-type nitrate/sulfonate/bicarbonate transport system substrate-binding protein
MILTSWGCESAVERPPEVPLKLSLSVSPSTYSGLIAVADEKGYFKEAGLDVALDFQASGRGALDAVCRGKAQVATVADIAFSARASKEHSIRIFASIGTTVGSQIIARRDRNIQNPCDLKGKRVGFSANTVSDYFLYAFFMTEGIPLKNVTAVNLPPAQQVEAIVKGDVDAVSAFETFGKQEY